jgi:hypothetical protein
MVGTLKGSKHKVKPVRIDSVNIGRTLTFLTVTRLQEVLHSKLIVVCENKSLCDKILTITVKKPICSIAATARDSTRPRRPPPTFKPA